MTRLRARLGLMLLVISVSAVAASPSAPPSPSATSWVLAQGARDGAAPAWAIAVATPTGWTRDCCVYARAIGVNAVVYQGEWSGEPQRVMVLNVWPYKDPTLGAEIKAGKQRYLQLDPAGKVATFAVRHPTMTCEAVVYQGSDHINDMVMFCDPGAATGVRLSWSMTINANDPLQRSLLNDFMQVVMATRYQRQSPSAPAHAG